MTIEPGTGVIRFGLRPVTGIDPTAVSPWWMQRRLLLSGIRAISPAVDVTNYVMLELGHPMHAHDRSLITGGFKVRFAEPGETVLTLDDIERKLDPPDVLIVDDVATAAIGGVMGAGTTEVRDTTTDVMLEAAVWDPAAVSRTQRRLHLTSEAGRRYERTVDPAVSMPALDRAATLLADIAGGTIEPRLTDWRGDPPRDDWSQPPVSMAVDLPDRMAGVDYADGTTQRRLTQIGADVVTDGDRVTATPPSWRPDLRAARRPRRGGAATGGPRDHPLGAAAGACRARPHPDPEAPPRHRKVVGAQRLRRDPSDAVPACGRVRPVGPARRRPAPHHHPGAQPAGVRPPAAGHHAVARTAGGVGAQRVPRRGRRRAVRDRSGRRADFGNPCRRTHSEQPQAHRRGDRHTRRVAPAAAAARRRGPGRPA